MAVKVGDRLFVAIAVRRSGVVDSTYWVTVTKVGRRWAEFQREGLGWRHAEHRFDLDTMRLDGAGFSSPGRVYPSEEAYRTETRLNELWSELRNRFDRLYMRPDGVDEIRILKAADALGRRLESE